MRALEDLVVDGRAMDRELVGTILSPYLRIERASCDLIPLAPWDAASTDVRVLLYLLARRAMCALGLPVPGGRQGATPVEIERATGIPGGSVRPALRRLLKERVVAKQDGIGYIVPNYAMGRIGDYVRPRCSETLS